MENTAHDLSAGELKLDYQALCDTASIAVSKCCERIENYLGKIRSAHRSREIAPLYLNANWLKQEAERLEISAETLAALIGGETREEKILVNIPKIKE